MGVHHSANIRIKYRSKVPVESTLPKPRSHRAVPYFDLGVDELGSFNGKTEMSPHLFKQIVGGINKIKQTNQPIKKSADQLQTYVINNFPGAHEPVMHSIVQRGNSHIIEIVLYLQRMPNSKLILELNTRTGDVFNYTEFLPHQQREVATFKQELNRMLEWMINL